MRRDRISRCSNALWSFKGTPKVGATAEHIRLGAYSLVKVCEIEPSRDIRGELPEFNVHARYQNAKNLPLNPYGRGPFCSFSIPRSWRLGGVYAISLDENVVYIGEAEDLSQRFNAGYGHISPRNCFVGGQNTNCKVNHFVLSAAVRGVRLALWFLGTPNRKHIEQRLISELSPPWNGRMRAR